MSAPISSLPVAIASNLGDVVPIVQGGVTRQMALSLLLAATGAPVTKTTNFTLADTEDWVICNGSGTITATMPAASVSSGRAVNIKTIAAQAVVSASSNVCPVTSATPGTAILAGTAGKWARLVSDGSNWIVMAAG